MLVLDEEIPYPLNSGKRIRTWNLLRHLAGKHAITYLCYGQQDSQGYAALASLGMHVQVVAELSPPNSAGFYAGALGNLLSAWPYSVARHHTARYREAVRRLALNQRFDLVHCEWTPYASYRAAAGACPMLIMAHNIEATVWRRRAEHASNLLEQRYMSLQAARMERFERRSFQAAEHVAAVTEEEKRTALAWGARAVSLISNGVDTETLRPDGSAPEPGFMLFLGSLDWQPNRDALLYLIRDILPKIQESNPDAVLHVVGRQPAAKLREQVEGVRGVEWVGEVPEIRPWFARAAVVLVPLRIGGGSRIKILESLGMGKPVVTTSIGAEGLDVISGRDCLIADTPTDFARSVSEVLRSPQRGAELGRNGRRLAVEQYDWQRLSVALEHTWYSTAASRNRKQLR